MNNNQLIIGGVVLVALVVGGFLLISNKQTTPAVDQTTTQTQAPVATAESSNPADSSAPETEGVTKEFTVTGSNFKFVPASLTVNQGDSVKITFTSSAGIHDFALPDFNIQTKQISGGESETVTFTASKKGSFEYFCSVGNHRAMGMKGMLTVQ